MELMYSVSSCPVGPAIGMSLSIKWRRGKDMPHGTIYCHVIIINDVVYVGGGDVVLEYHPGRGDWSKLPKPHLGGFVVASLHGRLIIVGGSGGSKILRVWDGAESKWAQSYPAMPTGRSGSAAVGYQHYLIVACGSSWKYGGGVDAVEVLDGSSHRWYSAQPVPMGGYAMSSVIIGNHWYLSSSQWNDGNPHIFTAHLPTLVSSAMSPATTNTPSI